MSRLLSISEAARANSMRMKVCLGDLRPFVRSLAALGMTILASATMVQSATLTSPVDQLIPWLLDEDRQLRGIPFREVIVDVTGKKVLAFDSQNEIDRRVVKQISAVFDEVTRCMNASDSAIQNIVRVMKRAVASKICFASCSTRCPDSAATFRARPKGACNARVIPICVWSILRAAACFILIRKLYETGSRDSSFRASIPSRKSRPTKRADNAVNFIIGFGARAARKNGH